MYTLYKVKSFSENAQGGNLAGVIPNAQDLSGEIMQSIAAEVNASECAFVLPSSKADIRIRWFTPNTEVSVCVHATMAALGVLRAENKIPATHIRIETKNAILHAQFKENTVFVKIPCYKLLLLNTEPGALLPVFPLDKTHIVGTPGIIEIFDDRELMIEVSSFRDLQDLKPDLKKYADLCRTLNITGISIFTRDTLNKKNQIHTREFAPLYGYLEDPLCGMAAGAIQTYLNKESTLRIEQGHFCKTSGIIVVESNTLGEVWVGGAYHILGHESVKKQEPALKAKL